MCSDSSIMAGRVTCQWMGGASWCWRFCSWHGAFMGACLAADLPTADGEAEEDLPDMNHVRAWPRRAAPGRRHNSRIFTWLRGLHQRGPLVSPGGQPRRSIGAIVVGGVLDVGPRNDQESAEAARVLRLAADTIESSSATGQLARVALPEVGRAERTSPAVQSTSQPSTGTRLVRPTHRQHLLPQRHDCPRPF